MKTKVNRDVKTSRRCKTGSDQQIKRKNGIVVRKNSLVEGMKRISERENLQKENNKEIKNGGYWLKIKRESFAGC